MVPLVKQLDFRGRVGDFLRCHLLEVPGDHLCYYLGQIRFFRTLCIQSHVSSPPCRALTSLVISVIPGLYWGFAELSSWSGWIPTFFLVFRFHFPTFSHLSGWLPQVLWREYQACQGTCWEDVHFM